MNDADWGRGYQLLGQDAQQATDKVNQPNAFMGGLYGGWHGVLGDVGALGGAIGTATGNKWMQDQGNMIVGQQAEQAQKWGRPDLDTLPWKPGGGGWSGVPAYLAHAAGGALPTLGAFVGGSAVGGALGGPVGAAVGATAAMYPSAVGGMYKAAGPDPTQGQSEAALAAGVPMAAVQSIVPGGVLGKMFGKGPLAFLQNEATGSLAKRALTGGAQFAGLGAIQSGVSSAVDTAFNTKMTPAEKMQAVVDATTGGLVTGGVLGAVTGAIGHKAPSEVTNEALTTATDPKNLLPQQLALSPPDSMQMPSPGGEAPRLGLPPPSDANRPPNIEEPGGQLRMGTVPEANNPALLGTPYKPEVRPETEQPTLPGINSQTRAAQVATMQTQLAREAGLRAPNDVNTFISNLNVTDRPGLIVAMRKLFADPDADPSTKMLQLGETYGVIDKKGNIQTTDGLRGELARVIDQYDAKLDKLRAMRDDTNISVEDKQKALTAAARFRDTNVRPLRELISDHEVADRGGIEPAPAPAQAPEAAPAASPVKVRWTDEPSPEAQAVKLVQGAPFFGEGEISPLQPKDQVGVETDPLRAMRSEGQFPPPVEAPDYARSAFSREGGLTAEFNPADRPPISRGEPIPEPGDRPPLDVIRRKVPKTISAAFEQPPKSDNEVRSLQGQLQAIIESKTDGNITEHPAEMKARAAAALNDLNYRGNAKSAYTLLNDPSLNYRAIKSLEDQASVKARSSADLQKPLPEGALAAEAVVYPPPAMSEKAFNTYFVKAVAKLPPGASPNFKIVATPGDLPPHVLSDLAAKGENINKIRGVMDRRADGSGTDRYLVRSAMQSPADIQELVAHEYVHGQTGDSTLLDIFNKAGSIEGVMKAAKEKGVDKELQQYIPRGEMTPRDKMDFADELLALVGGRNERNTNRFIDKWAKTIKDAFADSMRSVGLNAYADKLEGSFSAIGAAKALRDMRGLQPGVEPTDLRARAAYSKLPEANDDPIKSSFASFTDLASKIVDLSQRAAVGSKMQQYGFAAVATDWLKRYDPLFRSGGLGKFIDAMTSADELKMLLYDPVKTALSGMSKLDPKVLDRLTTLQRYTGVGINPMKPWGEHTWLHDAGKDTTELEQMTGEANKLWAELGQRMGSTPGGTGQQAFLDSVMANQFHLLSNHASLLYAALQQDGYTGPHPVFAFKDNPNILGDVKASTDFMGAQWRSLQAEAKARIAANKDTDPNSPMQGAMNAGVDALTSAAQVPYFHLGHGTGDNFVSANIRKLADGSADPAAASAVQDLLTANNFTNIRMLKGSSNNAFYARVQNVSQQGLLENVLRKAQAAGLLDAEDPGVQGGPRISAAMVNASSPEYMKRMIQVIDAAGLPEEAATRTKTMLLDLLPDNSLMRQQQARKMVHGVTDNPLQDMADHSTVVANSLAQLATSSVTNPAFSDMVRDYKTALADSNMAPSDRQTMMNVMGELRKRQVNMPWKTSNTFLSATNDWSHTLMLGLSPGYTLEQIGQLQTLTVPKLAEKYGFARSEAAMISTAPRVGKILKAMIGSHPVEATVVEADLTKAGVSAKDVNTIMRMQADGSLFMGGFTTGQTSAPTGINSRLGQARRIANSTAVWSEAASRVITGLTAGDLYDSAPNKAGGLSRDAYIKQTIDTAMYNWQSGNAPRFMTQKGPLGLASPIAFKFMGFQSRMLGTLYERVATAANQGYFSPDTPAAERAQAATEARRFLASHLATSATLAGTMGLPAFGFALGAMTHLSGMLPFGLNPSGEPMDMADHYREFLTHLFGDPTIAEAIAKGVPRALGVDTSNLSDENLIPGTQAMLDRRKLEDAAPAWAMSMLGAPGSLAYNFLRGSRDIYDGNVLQGLKEMSPTGLKGALKAYQMSTEGYVNREGKPLPLTVKQGEIATQLLGFTPGREAEALEQSESQAGHNADVAYNSELMKSGYMRATQANDQPAAQSWLNTMMAHDTSVPDRATMPSLSDYMKSWMENPEEMRAMGLPANAKLNEFLYNQQHQGVYNTQ